LLCSHVTIEVELNGRKATLRREIAEAAGQPMLIFGSSYDVAINAPIDEWKKYPYRRSASLESFSQALFRLLGWPEVTNEDGGNLTMHQVLRLLYADQLSPVESLFRFERFDPPTLRDAVGRLLCGAYDNAIYEGELEIKGLERKFETIAGELKSLSSVLGRPDAGFTFEWILGRRAALEREQHELLTQIEEEERQLFAAKAADELTLTAQNDAYARVQALQQELADAERERDALNFSIADSAAFISNLEAKVTALNDSALVADHLGDVRFSTCPACYAPIEEAEAGLTHACHLCRTPFDSERSRSRIVAMVNEAGVQLKQSRQLQERRLTKLEEVQNGLASLQLQWEAASKLLAETRRLPSTDAQERLRSLNRRAGYLERELESLTGQEKIVRMIAELSGRKEEINRQITKIRGNVETAKFVLQRRFDQAYAEIESEIIDLLKNDLRRQDSFENPNSVEFDFGANRISVDGQSYFSASSRVVLKSSFFLGFWAAATRDPGFRHPRFAIIDTIEDKGMEPGRSHNFQNQILRKSRQAKSPHQIIYATAMISPELDEPEYTIGRFSTRDDPTLAVEV
jgi:hypothetical protein